MTKQPWLKFYPSDWRGDLSLGPCSLAARGLWMEMLCIMSDATPRGSLVKDGEQYTMKRLAAVARASVRDVEKLLAELEAEGVFSRDPDGTIFSRRMRRDVEKAEQDRRNGGKGGNPLLKKDRKEVNPKDNVEVKAQKPEATDHNPEEDAWVSVRARVTSAFARANSPNTPDTSRVSLWRSRGHDPEICIAIVSEMVAKKPDISGLKYFDQAIADAHVAPRPQARDGPRRSASHDGRHDVLAELRAAKDDKRDHQDETRRPAGEPNRSAVPRLERVP